MKIWYGAASHNKSLNT